MSVACEYVWEMLFGRQTPYRMFSDELFSPTVFSTGSAWDDITRDVRLNPAPSWTRGMYSGGSPLDRVAGVGALTLSVNNFPYGSPGKLGYYTPGHVNQRIGFGLGIGCRLRVVYKELNKVLFIGAIESITVAPGEHASRDVAITVVDWMEEAATSQVEGIETLTDVRSDEAFMAIVQSLPRQPLRVQADIGMDTYPYAVDTVRDEGMTAQSEFMKLAMSELGFIYLKADGTLVFEGRSKRGADSPTNVYTFNPEKMSDIQVRRTRTDIINKVKVITHPRRVDATPVVLYRLVQPFQVAPGQTTRLFGGYSDPEQRGRRVGGRDFINPLVAGVDYIANTAADSSGVDITPYMQIVASTTGNGVSFSITNAGQQAGYLTTLQIRGRGIYDFENAVMQFQNDASIAQFGQRTRTIDMPYQSDADVGYSAAQYIISLYSDSISTADSMTYLANESDEVMRQALVRDISDRIGIRETVTGITDDVAGTTATRGWFINGVRAQIISGRYLTMTYVLMPADRNTYWILGVGGASELGINTRPGYGIFAGS